MPDHSFRNFSEVMLTSDADHIRQEESRKARILLERRLAVYDVLMKNEDIVMLSLKQIIKTSSFQPDVGDARKARLELEAVILQARQSIP